MVEKPVGLDLKSAERILELVADNRADVFVANERRHYSSTKKAMQLLASIEGKRVVQVHDQEDPKTHLQTDVTNLCVTNGILQIQFI